MGEADRGDAGIVDLGSGDAGCAHKVPQRGEVIESFRKEVHIRHIEECLRSPDRLVPGSWRTVDPLVGHHGQELMNARPRDRAASATRYGLPQRGGGR